MVIDIDLFFCILTHNDDMKVTHMPVPYKYTSVGKTSIVMPDMFLGIFHIISRNSESVLIAKNCTTTYDTIRDTAIGNNVIDLLANKYSSVLSCFLLAQNP